MDPPRRLAARRWSIRVEYVFTMIWCDSSQGSHTRIGVYKYIRDRFGALRMCAFVVRTSNRILYIHAI